MPTLDPNHPEWKAFVVVMRANPADDSVRLGFADWVEEVMGGAAFAGLIRSMVEVAKADPTNLLSVTHWDERRFPGQTNWNHYADAERFLKSAWGAWSPLPQMHMHAKDLWRFHRGFPDTVVLDWHGLKWLDTLCAIGPVGTVEVTFGAQVRCEVFDNTIHCTLEDPLLSRRVKSPCFVLERGDRSREQHVDWRSRIVKSVVAHFLGEIWEGKVQTIRYTNKPNVQVWPTIPGAGVLLPWQDPLGMDRLNHSG